MSIDLSPSARRRIDAVMAVSGRAMRRAAMTIETMLMAMPSSVSAITATRRSFAALAAASACASVTSTAASLMRTMVASAGSEAPYHCCTVMG